MNIKYENFSTFNDNIREKHEFSGETVFKC